jgi:hypothetical protein
MFRIQWNPIAGTSLIVKFYNRIIFFLSCQHQISGNRWMKSLKSCGLTAVPSLKNEPCCRNPVSNKRYQRIQIALEQGLDAGMSIASLHERNLF